MDWNAFGYKNVVKSWHYDEASDKHTVYIVQLDEST